MRLTKNKMVEEIENHFRCNPGVEVCVSDFQHELRNGRYGLKAYVMVSDNGQDVWCRPWAFAHVMWHPNWDRLTKSQVDEIHMRIVR